MGAKTTTSATTGAVEDFENGEDDDDNDEDDVKNTGVSLLSVSPRPGWSFTTTPLLRAYFRETDDLISGSLSAHTPQYCTATHQTS